MSHPQDAEGLAGDARRRRREGCYSGRTKMLPAISRLRLI